MINKYGRQPLYIVGSTGMALSLASLVAAVLLGSFHGVLALVLILLYLAFFASCIGPVFWTLVPELFPNHLRESAMSVPVLIQWLANAGVVLLFPLVFHTAGKAFTFSFLALMALAQGVFAWRGAGDKEQNSRGDRNPVGWSEDSGTGRCSVHGRAAGP